MIEEPRCSCIVHEQNKEIFQVGITVVEHWNKAERVLIDIWFGSYKENQISN